MECADGQVMGLFDRKRWKPVSVLTGFLGSGKTTVLQRLLSQPEMANTALIINEFGEVSVDHLLVETSEEKMVVLANGCVCCSVRGDLVQAVRSLFVRMQRDEIPPFRRILLETTGLADPASIVQTLIGPALASYPVYFDTIVTTVDATNALEAMAENPQMLAQIAVADSLLITKTDIASRPAIQVLEEDLRARNPRAQIQQIEQGFVDSSVIFGQRLLDPTANVKDTRQAVERMLSSRAPSSADHNDGITSFVITREEALSYRVFDQFMRALCGYRGQDLLRVKGLVKLEGSENRPSVVHGVQSVMHPPIKLRKWPASDQRTQLVFITRNITHKDVEALLSGIEGGFR